MLGTKIACGNLEGLTISTYLKLDSVPLYHLLLIKLNSLKVSAKRENSLLLSNDVKFSLTSQIWHFFPIKSETKLTNFLVKE